MTCRLQLDNKRMYRWTCKPLRCLVANEGPADIDTHAHTHQFTHEYSYIYIYIYILLMSIHIYIEREREITPPIAET